MNISVLQFPDGHFEVHALDCVSVLQARELEWPILSLFEVKRLPRDPLFPLAQCVQASGDGEPAPSGDGPRLLEG